MWKKIIGIVIIINLMLINVSVIYADDENESISEDDYIQVTSNDVIEEPKLNSRIAIAYDRKSGNVIWGKDENKRSAMASTTKIMTSLILIENADLTQTVTISAKAGGTGGSRLGLKKNDKITLKDLLYGLMLKSGNDAAVAIAETVGGSVEGFSDMMNAKAKELGLENTHYVTPHGLDNPDHYTTAYELAKLADYALNNETFAKVVNTKSYTVIINGYPKTISNTNELLGYLEGVNGVKTGFTNNAGRCLVTSVNRNGFEIITVVLQADTKKFRTSDSIKLINYVYENYELFNIKEVVDEKFNNWCQINQNRIQVNKSNNNNNMKLYTSELDNELIPIKKSDKDKVDVEINNLFYFEAPVVKDETVGSLKVCLNNEIIDVLEIKNKETIEKKDIWDYVKIFAYEFCN
ncbi:MAG: D-alanyl-D-alanine carboxypeptidase [Clostridia bacterium]|nr:D-alanyl-D-alanine carboxypeptidase [Clostridia bacterium]